MKLGIMQPYLFPYIGYFQLINSVDKFVIYDNIQYTKKGWINRNRLLVNGKDKLFTIPLKKDSDYLNINKRYLSNNSFEERKKLLFKIKNYYNKAPFYNQSISLIEECLLYENNNLFEFIFNSVKKICTFLNIDTKIIISSSIKMDHNLKGKERVIEICRNLDADEYINAIGGIELYDKNEFKLNKIMLNFIKSNDIIYKQYQSKFIPWLSIIDIKKNKTRNNNMQILIIGQCTLHWGRMEYGNIGNYYIIEPMIRQLHRVFPGAVIKTTMQMSDDFCHRESIARLPLELYYSWDDDNYYDLCMKELGIATLFNKTGELPSSTPYIKEVIQADLVIDFSGDIWSDNADFVGPKRFEIGLIKDRVAQLLRKKTIMIAGSPTPLENHKHTFTKEVFEAFDLVTNRENISYKLLKKLGYDMKNVKNFACPAFLFKPASSSQIQKYIDKYHLDDENYIKTGFILCGWNLKEGPYDKEMVQDSELINFVEAVEDFLKNNNTKIYFMSHSNGFNLPPNFELKHGRDFPFAKQIYEILIKRNKCDTSRINLVVDILNAWETKAFIGQFDMLISGRIHGAVAGLSQNIPTVIIDYGHEPKAHKLKGFAEIAGVENYIADPNNKKDLIKKMSICFDNRSELQKKLTHKTKEIQQKINDSFDILKHFKEV